MCIALVHNTSIFNLPHFNFQIPTSSSFLMNLIQIVFHIETFLYQCQIKNNYHLNPNSSQRRMNYKFSINDPLKIDIAWLIYFSIIDFVTIILWQLLNFKFTIVNGKLFFRVATLNINVNVLTNLAEIDVFHYSCK